MYLCTYVYIYMYEYVYIIIHTYGFVPVTVWLRLSMPQASLVCIGLLTLLVVPSFGTNELRSVEKLLIVP